MNKSSGIIDSFAFKSFSTIAMTPNKNPIANDPKKIAYTYNFIFLFVPINFRFPKKMAQHTRRPRIYSL